MIFLRQKYKQKPKQWGPDKVVRSIIAERAEDFFGISYSNLLFYCPHWQAGNQTDYGYLNNTVTDYRSIFDRNSLYFNTSNTSFLSVPSFLNALSELTCIQTVETDYSAISTDQSPFGQWGVSNQFLVWFDEGYDAWQVVFSSSANNSYIVQPGTITPSTKPETVISTYDGSTLSIFVDGVGGGSVSARGVLQTTSSDFIYIGASNEVGYGRGFDGYIHQTLFLSKSISSDKVSEFSDNPYRLIHPPVFRSYFVPLDPTLPTINFTGDVSGYTWTNGGFYKKAIVSGDMYAVSDLAGSVSVKKYMSGGVTSYPYISGGVSVSKQLSGLVSAISGALGQITITQVGEKIYLTGYVSAQSDTEASGVYVKNNISGSIEPVVDISGGVSAKLNLSGSVDSIANIIGEISRLGEGLGIIIDPTIDSISKKYTIHSI